MDNAFVPLPKSGSYPGFKRYPVRALEVQRAERARVRDEEAAVRDRERTLVALEVRFSVLPSNCGKVCVRACACQLVGCKC